jgi:TetR/AcrR family transcriptional regulator, transcriptional repressor for nem operon
MSLKDEIIHESIKLFSLKGYANTGINEIISSVNSSKGGFYNHFETKEQLFFEVLAESQKLWRDRTLHGLDEIDSPVQKIIKFLENYKDRYLTDSSNFPGGCIFITLSVELDDQHPDLCRKINEGFSGVQRMIRRYLDESKMIGELKSDVNTDQISEMIFTCMLGASVTFGVDKSVSVLEKTIRSLIYFLNQQKS